MNKHSITAIIPAYNAEEYLAESIESVLAQNRPVERIIVVDDCSLDRTPDIAQSYSKVLYLRTPKNSGHATARNIAIDHVQTPLTAWIDADDLWEPEHLETVAALLDEHEEAGVACSPVIRFGASKGVQGCIFTDNKPVNAVDECFHSTCVPAMSAVTRTSTTKAVGGFDPSYRYAPDFDFWLRMSLHCPFISVQTPTAKYRWHSRQISTNTSGLPVTMRQRESIYRSRFHFANGDIKGTEGFDLEKYRRWIREFYQQDLPLIIANSSPEDCRKFDQIAGNYVPGSEALSFRRALLGVTPKIAIRLYLKALRAKAEFA
ncbi:putative glycosyltransferase EpsE [Rubripirellula obstinata]|uniref:Putative glycosyltransferase EpsE n=1 Tax=Rubripirellula obstinata TaxID=406547 RepID=A0A5B1CK83_9BACT|nr:glycosyltransferase [Rubripirellula obstinata]KAA1259813.1 putative glycosyltransferase EpsE [Rubripirellula obstinata]